MTADDKADLEGIGGWLGLCWLSLKSSVFSD